MYSQRSQDSKDQVAVLPGIHFSRWHRLAAMSYVMRINEDPRFQQGSNEPPKKLQLQAMPASSLEILKLSAQQWEDQGT